MKTKQPPYTPEQAVNNCRLFLELSDRNEYRVFRESVAQIASDIIDRGIESPREKQLKFALKRVLKWIDDQDRKLHEESGLPDWEPSDEIDVDGLSINLKPIRKLLT